MRHRPKEALHPYHRRIRLFADIYAMGVLDRPEGRQFQTGRLGELYATSMKISEMRDSLVSQLKARCEKGLSKGSRLTRERIVAGFFAEYFSDEPSYADLKYGGEE